MPRFHRYRALDAAGQIRQGRIAGEHLADALARLERQDLRVLELEPESVPVAKTAATPASGRITAAMRINLLTEMAALLGAGVSLAEVAPSLEQAYAGTPLAVPLTRMRQRLVGGGSVADSFREAGLGLAEYVLTLIAAGEAAGRLSEAFADAGRQMEQEQKLAQEMQNALIYPCVLVGAGVVAVLIIFFAVVPRFATLLKSGRAEIPAISRWVIESGLYMQQHWLGALLFAIGVVGGGIVVLRQPATRRALLDGVARLPLVGPWLMEREIGRWAGLLATLMENRVPLLTAMELSARAVTLDSLRQHLLAAQGELRRGRSLADILQAQGWIHPVRLNLVRVGERSGSLASMLAKLALLNRDAAYIRQKRLLALIEPAAILIIGAVIGFIMVAVMLALASLNTARL